MTNQSSIISLQENLNSIANRIILPDQKDEALKEYNRLISDSPLSASNIITALTHQITKVNPSTKDILNFLPLLLTSSADISIKCLNDILALLKLSITISNCPMFHFISKIFGQMVSSFYSQSQVQYTKTLTTQSNKALYSFCNDLLINEDYAKAKGLAFLLFTELIDNSTAIITDKKYIIAIMDNINKYLGNGAFYHKLEVINCLLSLIYATEEKFKAYANDALYMILDYLNDNDWLIRKLCLNVVYSLSYYCFSDIMSLIEDMRKCFDELRKDDVAEVREVCIQTIKLIEEKCAVLNKKKIKDVRSAKGNDNGKKSTKRNKENIDANTIETKLNQIKTIKEHDKIIKPTCNKKKTLKPSSSSLGGNGRSENKSYQQPYTSNDIHSALTGKLKLKNTTNTLKKSPNESHMPFSLDSSMNNTKSQLSFISLKKNASDISIHLKQTNANSINNGSRNNHTVISQPKYAKDNIMCIDSNNNNDRVNYTQSEINISQIKQSPFERLYSSSIRNPKKRAENSNQEMNDDDDNNNKIILVNKAKEGNSNSSNIIKNKSSSVKKLPKAKQISIPTKKAKAHLLSPKNTTTTLKTIQSPKSSSNDKIESDLNSIINELISVISTQTENNKEFNQPSIIGANQSTESLSNNFSLLNTALSQLDDLSMTSFLFTNQAMVVKLIKILIDLNDFDKAITLMIKDNGLLFKCIPLIKKQRYTQITKKSIEVLLTKIIDIINIGNDTERLLDVITIVLNNKLSIPNKIKSDILKSIEYLLTHNKREITLSEQSNQSIRYIIAHLSNK